jgi:antitoxin (DNA-binding transcriptional repressor) of toxin-antitoxin stability system
VASRIVHRGVAIVILDAGEAVAQLAPNCIAIRRDDAGWWTCFVGADGAVEEYDQPYASRDEALWAAKAAAEYGI